MTRSTEHEMRGNENILVASHFALREENDDSYLRPTSTIMNVPGLGRGRPVVAGSISAVGR